MFAPLPHPPSPHHPQKVLPRSFLAKYEGTSPFVPRSTPSPSSFPGGLPPNGGSCGLTECAYVHAGGEEKDYVMGIGGVIRWPAMPQEGIRQQPGLPSLSPPALPLPLIPHFPPHSTPILLSPSFTHPRPPISHPSPLLPPPPLRYPWSWCRMGAKSPTIQAVIMMRGTGKTDESSWEAAAAVATVVMVI